MDLYPQYFLADGALKPLPLLTYNELTMMPTDIFYAYEAEFRRREGMLVARQYDPETITERLPYAPQEPSSFFGDVHMPPPSPSLPLSQPSTPFFVPGGGGADSPFSAASPLFFAPSPAYLPSPAPPSSLSTAPSPALPSFLFSDAPSPAADAPSPLPPPPPPESTAVVIPPFDAVPVTDSLKDAVAAHAEREYAGHPSLYTMQERGSGAFYFTEPNMAVLLSQFLLRLCMRRRSGAPYPVFRGMRASMLLDCGAGGFSPVLFSGLEESANAYLLRIISVALFFPVFLFSHLTWMHSREARLAQVHVQGKWPATVPRIDESESPFVWCLMQNDLFAIIYRQDHARTQRMWREQGGLRQDLSTGQHFLGTAPVDASLVRLLRIVDRTWLQITESSLAGVLSDDAVEPPVEKRWKLKNLAQVERADLLTTLRNATERQYAPAPLRAYALKWANKYGAEVLQAAYKLMVELTAMKAAELTLPELDASHPYAVFRDVIFEQANQKRMEPAQVAKRAETLRLKEEAATAAYVSHLVEQNATAFVALTARMFIVLHSGLTDDVRAAYNSHFAFQPVFKIAPRAQAGALGTMARLMPLFYAKDIQGYQVLNTRLGSHFIVEMLTRDFRRHRTTAEMRAARPFFTSRDLRAGDEVAAFFEQQLTPGVLGENSPFYVPLMYYLVMARATTLLPAAEWFLCPYTDPRNREALFVAMQHASEDIARSLAVSRRAYLFSPPSAATADPDQGFDMLMLRLQSAMELYSFIGRDVAVEPDEPGEPPKYKYTDFRKRMDTYWNSNIVERAQHDLEAIEYAVHKKEGTARLLQTMYRLTDFRMASICLVYVIQPPRAFSFWTNRTVADMQRVLRAACSIYNMTAATPLDGAALTARTMTLNRLAEELRFFRDKPMGSVAGRKRSYGGSAHSHKSRAVAQPGASVPTPLSLRPSAAAPSQAALMTSAAALAIVNNLSSVLIESDYAPATSVVPHTGAEQKLSDVLYNAVENMRDMGNPLLCIASAWTTGTEAMYFIATVAAQSGVPAGVFEHLDADGDYGRLVRDLALPAHMDKFFDAARSGVTGETIRAVVREVAVVQQRGFTEAAFAAVVGQYERAYSGQALVGLFGFLRSGLPVEIPSMHSYGAMAEHAVVAALYYQSESDADKRQGALFVLALYLERMCNAIVTNPESLGLFKRSDGALLMHRGGGGGVSLLQLHAAKAALPPLPPPSSSLSFVAPAAPLPSALSYAAPAPSPIPFVAPPVPAVPAPSSLSSVPAPQQPQKPIAAPLHTPSSYRDVVGDFLAQPDEFDHLFLSGDVRDGETLKGMNDKIVMAR